MTRISYLMPAILLAAFVFTPATARAANMSALSPNDQSTIAYPGGGYGGYGYWGYEGTTVAGSYARGLASLVRSVGDYRLASSAAAVNWSVARNRNIQNDKLWVDTYLALRDTNYQYRLAQIKRDRGDPRKFAHYARLEAPKPLANNQLDTMTGQIQWPILLTGPEFAAQRATIEKLFIARAYHGTLTADDYLAAARTIDQMSAQLSNRIATVPPQTYMNARTFLKSLAYEATRPAA